MKIERGILSVNTSNEIIVSSPLNIYKLSMESLLEREFRSNEKLLGVIVNNIFCKCEDFELKNKERIFGYIKKNDLDNSTITIQTIEDFNRKIFDPFNSNYILGKEININKNELTNFFMTNY
jgi:hypothetical protein